MEEEYEDKQKVLRERRDIEAKLLSAQDQVYNDTCKHSSFCISFPLSTSCRIQMQNIYTFGPILSLNFACLRLYISAV